MPALPRTISVESATGELESPPQNRAWVAAFLICITAAGAVLRFLYLDRKSFWLDEGVSVAMARLDWANLLHLLGRREANMAFYYVALRVWLHLGGSEFFIRSLSAVISIAAVPVIYVLGKRLFGGTAGTIAAALFSVHAWQVRYAQEARSYSLYVLLTACSCLFFLLALEQPSRRNTVGYVISSTLAAYSHLFALLVIAAQWVSIYLAKSKIRPSRGLFRALKVLSVLLLPLAIFVIIRGAGPISWIPRPGWSTLHEFGLFLTGNGGDLLLALYVACEVFGFFAVGHGSDVANTSAGWAKVFTTVWLLFPIVVTLGFSLLRPVFLARYLLACVTPAVLLASAGINRLRPRWMATLLLLVMLGLSLRGTFRYYHADFDLQREDWRNATQELLAKARPGDGILFHSAQARMPFEYYAGGRQGRNKLRVLFPAYGARLTYEDFLANARNARLDEIPIQASRVWLVLAHNRLKSGEPDATTEALKNFLAAHYSPNTIQKFSGGIEVALYSRE